MLFYIILQGTDAGVKSSNLEDLMHERTFSLTGVLQFDVWQHFTTNSLELTGIHESVQLCISILASDDKLFCDMHH
jgi:hypothetical protein